MATDNDTQSQFGVLVLEDVPVNEYTLCFRRRGVRSYISSLVEQMEPDGEGKRLTFDTRKNAQTFASSARALSSSLKRYPKFHLLRISVRTDFDYDAETWAVTMWLRTREKTIK